MAGPRVAEAELSATSRDWLERTTPEGRKALGQYLTPRSVAAALLDLVELRPGMRVLDPGVGTGELLAAAIEREPGLELAGWDVDPEAIAAARSMLPGADLRRRSALEPHPEGGFDLVIGNPPYFQMKPSAEQAERFRAVISGRTNIFALFFQAGMEALRPGGILAYIVPPSMNSGAYFEGLREYVTDRASVEEVVPLPGNDHFEGANTAVQILVLRKGGRDRRHLFERVCPESGFRRVVFSQDPELLAGEFEGRSTLWELGYEAVTGSVVWNRRRRDLRVRRADGLVPLVWSHNLRWGELELGSKPGKPQYIKADSPLAGPAILVNRVVGAVGRGELRTAAVPEGIPFLAENHVNVIRRRSGVDAGADWETVHDWLRDPAAAERVRLLTGNTQISGRELTHLLPLG